MKPPLQVGVCGLGFMGRTFLAALQNHPRARVVAVCDRNPDLRSGRWDPATGNLTPGQPPQDAFQHVAAYETPDELLRDPNVQAVIIALPTPLHADVTIRALSAGKHVLCEKPMARTLAECDRMIAAADRFRRILMIGHCVRFWPQYELVRELFNQGRLGRLRFIKLHRLSSLPLHSEGNWMIDGSRSGGALLDLQIHDVDFAYYLLGLPQRIYACGTKGPSGDYDHVLGTFTYPDGSYVLLEGAWTYHQPWPFDAGITVCGEKATAVWWMHHGPDVLLYAGGKEPERLACSNETGWKPELDYFVDCVLERKNVERCTPRSSRTSIALALLERQSIESGSPVQVPRNLSD